MISIVYFYNLLLIQQISWETYTSKLQTEMKSKAMTGFRARKVRNKRD